MDCDVGSPAARESLGRRSAHTSARVRTHSSRIPAATLSQLLSLFSLTPPAFVLLPHSLSSLTRRAFTAVSELGRAILENETDLNQRGLTACINDTLFTLSFNRCLVGGIKRLRVGKP